MEVLIIGVVFTGIGLIAILPKKLHKILTSIALVVILSGIFISNYINRPTTDIFSEIHMYDNTSIEDISIVRKDNKNVLFDNTNQEELLYKYGAAVFRPKFYSPVYLQDLDNYYLVIYSTDHTKTYQDNLFIQENPNLGNIDIVYIIDKIDSLMYTLEPAKYDLIGKTIKLNEISSSNDFLAFPIVEENQTAFYHLLVIDPEGRALTASTTIEKANNSFINKFVISDENIALWTNSNNQVNLYLLTYTFSIEIKNGEVIINTDVDLTKSNLLDNQIYVQSGYFTQHNGYIYYVNNYSEIFRIDQIDDHEYIGHTTDLEQWLDVLYQR